MWRKKRTWILIVITIFVLYTFHAYLSYLPKVDVGEVGKLKNSTVMYNTCVLGKSLSLHEKAWDLIGDFRSDDIIIPLLRNMRETGEIMSNYEKYDMRVQVLQNRIPNYFGISKIRIVDDNYISENENKEWYVNRPCVIPRE
jgi:hypothetical protein